MRIAHTRTRIAHTRTDIDDAVLVRQLHAHVQLPAEGGAVIRRRLRLLTQPKRDETHGGCVCESEDEEARRAEVTRCGPDVVNHMAARAG